MAFADCENVPSQRVLEKAGFKRGRVFKDHYILGVDRESGKRRSLQELFLQRPGTAPYSDEEVAAFRKPEHHWSIGKDTISPEDAASIREALANDGIERINKAL